MASEAILSRGMPGRPRVNAGCRMAGFTLRFGLDLSVGEVAWHSRIVITSCGKQREKDNDGECQSEEDEIRLPWPEFH
jgi:hypothetical protein